MFPKQKMQHEISQSGASESDHLPEITFSEPWRRKRCTYSGVKVALWCLNSLIYFIHLSLGAFSSCAPALLSRGSATHPRCQVVIWDLSHSLCQSNILHWEQIMALCFPPVPILLWQTVPLPEGCSCQSVVIIFVATSKITKHLATDNVYVAAECVVCLWPPACCGSFNLFRNKEVTLPAQRVLESTK